MSLAIQVIFVVFIVSLVLVCCDGTFVNKAAAYFVNAPIESNIFLDFDCSVTGSIPSYLTGSYFRVGPGFWDPSLNYIENNTHSHLFFGLSMIHVFHFDGPQIEYHGEFQKTGVYEKFFNGNTNNPLSPNTLICIRRFLDENSEYVYLSNSEISASNSFDPINVTIGDKPYIYKDVENIFELPWKSWAIKSSPAHAQTDLDGTIYHYVHFPCKRGLFGCKLSGADYYKIYYILPGTNERIFAGPEIKSKAYIDFMRQQNGKGIIGGDALLIQHSLGLTENYMIIIEVPFMQKMISNFWDLITENIKFDLKWVGDEYPITNWYVINKRTGDLHRSYTSIPFMTFHVANSYEVGNNIIIDMMEIPQNSYDALFIDNLLNNAEAFDGGKIIRWVLPLNADETVIEPLMVLSDKKCLEFPIYSYEKYTTKPYQYIYSVGGYSCNFESQSKSTAPDMLIKQQIPIYPDTTYSKPIIFREQDQFYSEPTFVPNPDGTQEDDGLLLSLTLDGNTNKTYVLILDAKDFKEVARVQPNVDVPIPYTIHGRYYPDI